MSINVTTLFSDGLLDENSYILTDTETGYSAVIDPDLIRHTPKYLADNYDIRLILLTHCHFDHVYSAEELRKLTGAKILVHKDDAKGLLDADINLSYIAGGEEISFSADETLFDGEKITLGNTEIEVLHTPGHTKGSVCFLADNVLFSGDTLFSGSVGRTDFPSGSFSDMMRSMQRLKKLDGMLTVYPGHGSSTSLESEISNNPYMNGMFS